MRTTLKKCTWVFSLFAMTLFATAGLQAQDDGGRTKLDWGDWPGSVTVGAGIRASFNSQDGAAPDGGWDSDFNIDNARLYVGATGHDILGLELNFDINNAQGFGTGTEAGEFRVLDAILKVEFGDLVNIWMGRMLPPSDRNNLSGPYYQNTWSFPFTQFGYYNIFQGRDDGAMVHGSAREGKLEYALGAYDGYDAPAGDDNVMIAGRFSYNFLENEAGYYNSSTYHGTKELLTVGFAFQNQQDAVAIGDDYDAYNFDLLYERPTSSGGVVTIEAAYYEFDGTGSANSNGHSYFILTSYMLSKEYAMGALTGRVVPYFRHQEYSRDAADAGARTRSNDFGMHYVIHGHNARLTLEYTDFDTSTSSQNDEVKLGMQLQF